MAFDFDIPTQKNDNKCLLTQKVPLFMTVQPVLLLQCQVGRNDNDNF